MSDRARNHIKTVCEATGKIYRELKALDNLCMEAELNLDDEQLKNEISNALGRVHTLGENAMNDYRVNRSVAKVERRWQAELETRLATSSRGRG